MSACRQCGEPITAPRGRRGPASQYCGATCRNRQRNPARAAARLAIRPPRAPGRLALQRVCLHCGGAYRSKERGAKYCSLSCTGFASHNDRRREPVPCLGCGTPFLSKGHQGHASVFCSRECAGAAGGRAQADHACAECSTPFRGGARRKFCSERCRGAWRKRVRDKRIANKEGAEHFSPREVFDRDGWKCRLCGDPCDQTTSVPAPLAATLDHIIPVSRGGPHTRANVRCAHFSCNSRRGARDVPEAA